MCWICIELAKKKETLSEQITSHNKSDLNFIDILWPLLLTWFNFNLSMDK